MNEPAQEASISPINKTINLSSPKLEIKRFYVKEQSCKVPLAPDIFNAEGKLETQLKISSQKSKRDNGEMDVTLRLYVTVKIGQQTAVDLQVEQVGIFVLQGFTKEQEDRLAGSYCLGLLYPYARKVVADLAMSAGFSGINLPPVNFDQMHLQQEKAKQKTLQDKQPPSTEIH